ncbi:stalk domain-containing protein [Paenibacillus yanchengensis]|uniref:Stalk domain-containing protein n=1 Tax=Paenibacillus yanchengensis TaxID=2035833 RepID=A0ABW4YI62_9BACL
MKGKYRIIITLSVIIALLFPASIASIPSQQVDAASLSKQLTVTLNGAKLQKVADMYIQRNVTMVELSSFLSALDYQIIVDDVQQRITARKTNKTIVFTENSSDIIFNGKTMSMPTKITTKQGKMYIPLRYIAKLDGNKVIWQSKQQTIELITMEAVALRIMIPTSTLSEDHKYVSVLNDLVKDMNMQTNTVTTIEEVPQQSYKDKLFIKMAAGDMSTLQLFTSSISGVSLDVFTTTLTPYINNYKQLRTLPKQVMEHVKLSYGDLLGVPKLTSAVDGPFPVLRQTLLDTYNFAVPTTMEELYIVLKNNSAKDKVGLTGFVTPYELGSLSFVEHIFNETPSRYKWENGKLTDLTLASSNRAALEWLQTLYQEGLLDPEFAVLTPEASHQRFADGTATVAALTFDEAAQLEQELGEKKKTDELLPLVSLKREPLAQEVTASSLSYEGIYFVPYWSGFRETNASLQVLDYLHQVTKDEKVAKQKRELATTIVGSTKVNMSHYEQSTAKRYATVEKQRQSLVVENRLDLALEKRLDVEQLKDKLDLDEQINQTKIKVIMGALSLTDWDKFVRKLQEDDKYQSLMKTYQTFLVE